MFNYRWGKGKKEAPKTLPNGEKITFLTVGGRTSCVVPSVQKKTGAVAGDIKKENADIEVNDSGEKTSKSKKRKGTDEKRDLKVEPKPEVMNVKGRKKLAATAMAKEDPKSKKLKVETPTDTPSQPKSKIKKEGLKEIEVAGRRRSGRNSTL